MTQPIALQLTGGFRLSGPEGAEIALAGRKARALIAIVALAPGQVASRARLKALLWGDRAEQQAGDSLRQVLAGLRKEAPGLLDIRDGEVGLTPDVAADVTAISEAAARGDNGAAAALYRGPLLDGLDLGDEPFEAWLAAERAALVGRMTAILERCQEGEHGAARIATAQRLLALDTLREASHRAVIAALLAAGEEALARKQLEASRALFQRELGVGLQPETESLSAAAKPAAPSSAKPVIAMLPFANLSDDPAQKYFSDGITADIATELSRFRQFIVRAAPPGQENDAAYAVHGSVRRMGRRIRISAALTDRETATRIWSEHFDAGEDEIFDMQDRIVQSIAAQLSDRLRVARVEKAARKPPASLAAYDLVLQGDNLPIGEEAVEARARDYFARAIALDPGYARAYAYLGHYIMLKWVRHYDAPDSMVDEAMALIRKAIELDDSDSFNHGMMAHACLWAAHLGQAEYHYLKARDLNPNQPGLLAGIGILYGYLGEPAKGLAFFDQARLLDPHFDPTWYWRNRGPVHFCARQYREAVTCFERSPIMPDWVEAYLAACHVYLGNLDAAHRHGEAALRKAPSLTIAKLLTREPIQKPTDVAHLAEGLRRAGIPD